MYSINQKKFEVNRTSFRGRPRASKIVALADGCITSGTVNKLAGKSYEIKIFVKTLHSFVALKILLLLIPISSIIIVRPRQLSPPQT